MEFGGREVNAAAVHVRTLIAQAVRLRADDAAVDDEGLPVVKISIGSTGVSPHRLIILEFLQDGELVTAEHGFGTVVKPHFVGVLRVGG